jgi:hypothetical protein
MVTDAVLVVLQLLLALHCAETGPASIALPIRTAAAAMRVTDIHSSCKVVALPPTDLSARRPPGGVGRYLEDSAN